jgi:hypothetical protein
MHVHDFENALKLGSYGGGGAIQGGRKNLGIRCFQANRGFHEFT